MPRLTSPRYSGMTVLLEPTEEVTNVMGGKSIAKAGRKIKFRNHIADVPDSWMPLVEKHPAFTGEGPSGRTIYLLSELMEVGTGPDTGVRVVHGAIGSRQSAAEPPHMDWDTMTPKEILNMISGWPNERLEMALDWERARRRRKAVLVGLVQELVGDRAEDPQPILAEEAKAKEVAKAEAIADGKGSKEIADTFEAKIPPGQDGI